MSTIILTSVESFQKIVGKEWSRNLTRIFLQTLFEFLTDRAEMIVVATKDERHQLLKKIKIHWEYRGDIRLHDPDEYRIGQDDIVIVWNTEDQVYMFRMDE